MIESTRCARSLREFPRHGRAVRILTNMRIVHVVVCATGIPMRPFITEMHSDEWGASLSNIDPSVRWAITEEGNQLWPAEGAWQKKWIEVA